MPGETMLMLQEYTSVLVQLTVTIVVVELVLLTPGACEAPSSYTGTSGIDRNWPEPAET